MQADKDNFHLYNSNLQPFANDLRKRMTKAEACLWKYALRAGSMKGYSFRRQRPVLKYIADFMCKELMLIIEVDGITHHSEAAKVKDKIRQDDLERVGFTVLRFADEEVLENMEGVISQLECWIESSKFPPPSPRARGTRRHRKKNESKE